MTTKTYWFEPIGDTINQKVKSTQIKYSQAKMLYNITHDKVGSWRTRPGRTLIDDTINTSSGVQGIGFYKYGKQMVIVMGGNVYKYSSGGIELVASSVFTSTANINMTNYLNRIYMFSDISTDIVKYYDGTNVVAAGDSTNTAYQFSAKFGCAVQNSLWVAVGDRVYVSNYNLTDNVPTDHLFEAGSDFVSSTRFFIMNDEVTGLISYRDTPTVLTANTTSILDINWVNTLQGAQKKLDIGTSSPRSVVIDTKSGYLLWADGKNGVFMWSGAGDAVNVGEYLIENAEQTGIINLINNSNLDKLAAGAINGKVFISLHDLTDTTLDYGTDCTIVFDIASNKWSVRNVEAGCYETARLDNENALYAGSYSTKSVYKLDVNGKYQDDDYSGVPQNYSSYIRSKDLRGEFGPGGNTKKFAKLITVYKSNVPITTSYSLNGSTTYKELGTIAASPEGSEFYVSLQPIGQLGTSISLEWRTLSGYQEIIGFGLVVDTYDTIAVRPT